MICTNICVKRNDLNKYRPSTLFNIDLKWGATFGLKILIFLNFFLDQMSHLLDFLDELSIRRNVL